MELPALPVMMFLTALLLSTEAGSLRSSSKDEFHVRATTFASKRLIQQQLATQTSEGATTEHDQVSRLLEGAKSSTTKRVPTSEETRTPAPEESDAMLMAGAGRSRQSGRKIKRGDDDDDDDDKKTLSQQIADGKYGLIEKEIYATTPKRPGIISYASNPEVPRDTAKNLGGLDAEEIWLAENHVLVLRGGFFPEHKFNRTEDEATVWPPIDNYVAPPRQVKIPANPKVPPPFPVQLKENGPAEFIGFNGSRPPFPPPFFPQPPPGNGSYFAPPFPFPPPPGNFTPGLYPPIPPGNFTPGGGFLPPPGNFTPGSGPFYPPPFPGFPPNGSLPFPPLPPLRNGTLPFPPHPLLANLPPGAALLPPPNLTIPFDEDDPSLYYPPPYDFFYPSDNSTEVPPGPLVPGIVLPPPPNFFAPLDEKPSSASTPPPPNINTQLPVPPHESYLSEKSRPHPTNTYLPVTTDIRRNKPRPTTAIPAGPDNEVLNHVSPPSDDVYVLTTPTPHEVYTVKPKRPNINIAPDKVQVIHKGTSVVEPADLPEGYYYEQPAVLVKPPETIYINKFPDKIYIKSGGNDDTLFRASPPSVKYNTPVSGYQRNASRPIHRDRERSHAISRGRAKHIITTTTTSTTTTTPAPQFLIYYDEPQQGNLDTNTVTPSPQPFYITTPEPAYHPSSVTTKPPPTVTASYYFYEEPEIQNGHLKDVLDTTPPETDGASRQRPQMKHRARPSYTTPNDDPVHLAQPEYILTNAGPPQASHSPIQNVASHRYGKQLQTPQFSVFSDLLSLLFHSSTPPPQYYYLNDSPPDISYNIQSHTTPRPPVRTTTQPPPHIKPAHLPVSNLAYFTTPSSDYVYEDEPQQPVLYNAPQSPQTIFQYSYESGNAFQGQRQEPQSYSTSRLRIQPQNKINHPSTTPRTVYEFSYEQQDTHTRNLPLQAYYTSSLQYDQHEDVTAASPTSHYSYENDGAQKNYQTPPQIRHYPTPSPQPIQPIVHSTGNPFHSYFTKQDESLLDNITKKYFTIFGQKLGSSKEGTTPLPPQASDIQSHSKKPNSAAEIQQYYTTPKPNHRSNAQDSLRKVLPISLESDINVNYQNPPPPNPYAEIINPEQLQKPQNHDGNGAFVSYKFPGDGGHVFFITPQVTRSNTQQSNGGYVYSIPDQSAHQIGIQYRRRKRKEER